MPTDPGPIPPPPVTPQSAGTSEAASPPEAPEPPGGAGAPDLLPPPPPDEVPPPFWLKVWRFMIGAPRSLTDRTLFHRLSLIPFLAWVGLGADGLSSSAYGPEEAFRALHEHQYLAVMLAGMTAATIFIIAAAYSKIIEEFPHGGGGYVVATKMLGPRVGVVSGTALLVDYVLTITISVAAAGDALFSMVSLEWHPWKLPMEIVVIAGLTTLNIRGVKESVMTLTPIFVVFLVTHAILIFGGILLRAPELPATAGEVVGGFQGGIAGLGVFGVLVIFLHAYSLGGGTYTGIEAVSNGLPIMREPRVQTAKRTMLYMAISLAVTAAGLLVCYLLWDVAHVEGKTLNAVLCERVAAGLPLGHLLIILTLLSEGGLLIVAAQAGMLDGPRVLANMAVDSWVPHRFSALSDRLTTQNGLVLMGVSSMAALLYTRGSVRAIVIMYSINVFLTFSLSMLGMSVSRFDPRRRAGHWKRRTALFITAFVLCATILWITVREKFMEGGWVTIAITGTLVLVCFMIRRHYRATSKALGELYDQLAELPRVEEAGSDKVDPRKPTAAVLVGSYGGLGIHTAFNIFRAFPGHFKGLVFLSVGVIDSGGFKGDSAIDELREHTEQMLKRYVDLARGLGVPATYRMGIGTDAVEEGAKLCMDVVKEFPHTTFFAGKVIFQRERWYERFLHNETAFAIQKRLQWLGRTMVIIPARIEHH